MATAKVFRWIEWNVEKVQRHGVTVREAETVVRRSGHGQTRRDGDKLVVQGRGLGERFVQVIYLIDDNGTIFIIHAMPLTVRKRRRKK